jgi:hypothetical protein
MTRWPPILWLCIAAGSLFLLVGWNGTVMHTPALVIGIVLILTGALGAVWMAFGRWSERPQVGGVAWLVPATVAFYIACAIAGLAAGHKYAIAAIVAGLIPFTAVTLLTATVRSKTVAGDGARRETTAASSSDPAPGIGADDETPLGDTAEHSDAERVATPDYRWQSEGRRSR